MATDLPKVQGYLPQAVYDALLRYKDVHQLKSVSQAVTNALCEFFGVIPNSDSPLNQGESVVTRVEAIEGK
jgi:hypothetical protein